MPQVTITRIAKAGGQVRVRFGKTEYEFASIEAMREHVRNKLNRDELEAIAMWLMLERQPNLNNPNAFEGHSVIVDAALANWGRID